MVMSPERASLRVDREADIPAFPETDVYPFVSLTAWRDAIVKRNKDVIDAMSELLPRLRSEKRRKEARAIAADRYWRNAHLLAHDPRTRQRQYVLDEHNFPIKTLAAVCEAWQKHKGEIEPAS